MQREDAQFHAALTAFSAAFAGARIVDRDVQLGEGLRWSWIAELTDGRLCAVWLVSDAGEPERVI